MEIKSITVEHPQLGKITVNSEIPQEVNDLIGTITHDFSKDSGYYHGDIVANDNGTFHIRNLCVVKPESISVGFMKTGLGSKTFVTLFTNRNVSDDITFYPSGVCSATYK